MQETYILDELRYLIRFKFYINTITPADCKFIANEIRLLTKKNISETTVKRLFGFARIKYNFSKYTLGLLSDFNAEILGQLNSDCWLKVKEKSREITYQTLLNIQNCSGIPYKHTIGRKFAEQHFDSFLNSSCSFTCFISQPGWGKTIILSQLAKSFLSNPVYEDSALLFVTVYDFLYEDFDTLSISHCIKNKLGIDSTIDLVEYLDKNCKNSKLVIFIDGFSRLKIKSDIKKSFISELNRFINEIQDSSIQLVMGIRSADWARFMEGTGYLTLFKKKWFPGEYFDPENGSNVLALHQYEIGLALGSINGCDTIIETELMSCLEVPLYLESYFQLRNDFSKPYYGNVTAKQIITHLIKLRVDNSKYFTEKMLLINKLINCANVSCGINKHDLEPEILTFGNAYKELLSDGILVERCCMNVELDHRVSIHFALPYLCEYFSIKSLAS